MATTITKLANWAKRQGATITVDAGEHGAWIMIEAYHAKDGMATLKKIWNKCKKEADEMEGGINPMNQTLSIYIYE